MKKIVINTCFGGFGLSHEAIVGYSTLAGLNLLAVEGTHFRLCGYDYYRNGVEAPENYWSHYEIERDDPNLVFVVESLGEKANGRHAELKVVSIPADVDWYIEDYDGSEHVAERHRIWK